jgi:hypothetical protein
MVQSDIYKVSHNSVFIFFSKGFVPWLSIVALCHGVLSCSSGIIFFCWAHCFFMNIFLHSCQIFFFLLVFKTLMSNVIKIFITTLFFWSHRKLLYMYIVDVRSHCISSHVCRWFTLWYRILMCRDCALVLCTSLICGVCIYVRDDICVCVLCVCVVHIYLCHVNFFFFDVTCCAERDLFFFICVRVCIHLIYM